MAEFSPGEISNREHIAPDKTGDNIAAKRAANYVWDGSNWQRMTQPGGSGGGGDGAILDGASATIKATVKNYTNANPLTVRLTDTNGDYVAAGAGTQYTEDAASAADPVGGMLIGRRRDTLTTSEVSTDGDNIALNATNKGQLHVKLADTVTVDGSGVTQPVSASSLPLPSGAATAAKQPALGTAGSASTDVITVQGIASMTALKVDGSAVTQPVSWSGQTVAATQSGTWTVQPGNTANTTAWLVKLPAKSISSQTALTTTATVSSAAGTYVGGSYINLNSAPAYIQIFDTTGAVTLGTTVPTFVQPIPANATAANGSAFVFDIPGGISIANGIKIAATTTATGSTTVSTALIGYTIYT